MNKEIEQMIEMGEDTLRIQEVLAEVRRLEKMRECEMAWENALEEIRWQLPGCLTDYVVPVPFYGNKTLAGPNKLQDEFAIRIEGLVQVFILFNEELGWRIKGFRVDKGAAGSRYTKSIDEALAWAKRFAK